MTTHNYFGILHALSKDIAQQLHELNQVARGSVKIQVDAANETLSVLRGTMAGTSTSPSFVKLSSGVLVSLLGIVRAARFKVYRNEARPWWKFGLGRVRLYPPVSVLRLTYQNGHTIDYAGEDADDLEDELACFMRPSLRDRREAEQKAKEAELAKELEKDAPGAGASGEKGEEEGPVVPIPIRPVPIN